MDHQLSENKLVLLYTIHEQENIKQRDLFDFVQFGGYMSFFDMQSCMQELEEAHLVVEMNQGETVYYTTLPEGDTVVEMFRARIPHSIREDIRNYVKNAVLSGSPLRDVDASIEKLDEDHYEVRCCVRDYDRSVLDFVKTASSEEAAYHIRNEWLKKGMSVYWNIVKELS